DDCSICTEKFEANSLVYELKCGHMFHKMCLRKWLNHKTICPYCRDEVIWL
ncbi:hypothetical protein HELRODRAFT_153619, partial [Helobdella robusta]|uniref:RING-type domain-containing protein n=1 Tax=Helobdella robusta TaxID=6412 RepID=T1ELA2_HELRO